MYYLLTANTLFQMDHQYFITVHGIDGTGKSATCATVVKLLNKMSHKAINYEEYENEHMNPISLAKKEVLAKCPPTEQFYYYLASTLFHSRQISLLMEKGYSVVKDRYIADVNAHHIHLGVENVEEVSRLVPILRPDLEVILVLDEKERRRRILNRGIKDDKDAEIKADGTRLDFFEKYLLKKEHTLKSLLLVIDTTLKSPTEVAEEIISKFLKVE